MRNLTGKKVSHHRVLELLGGGEMGVDYRVEDIKLGRMGGSDVPSGRFVHGAKSTGRFEREARAASGLNHPNICTVYEFGEHERHPFIAMEVGFTGLSVSPDGRQIIYPQVDEHISRVMLVENFH